MKNYSKYFYTPDDLPIMDLDQIYMTSSAYLATGFKDVSATFDLLVRDMPQHRNFMVFTGLEEIIRGIVGWRYTDRHVKILRHHKLISPKFGKYLKQFKFYGTVYAMPEGSFFFPGEPVVRITAPLIEVNLLTAFLITSLTSNSIFASKFIRSVLVAGKLNVIGTSPNRALAFEQAFKSQRSSFITGSKNNPSPVVREKLREPRGDAATIAYHAFIKSYPTELEAMQVAARNAKVELSLMIDTYDIKQGMKNALIVARDFQKKGKILKLVVDSGDLLSGARYVRKELDKVGLKNVRITLASNLDEYKIDKLIKAKAPANTFIVNTEALTSSDDPKMEAVFKLAEIIRGDQIQYAMKLSPGKVSLPGCKQVFRVFKNGKYHHDVIGLEGEKLGTPLLRPMIVKGKQVYKLPSVMKIRSFVAQELKKLPEKLKDIWHEHMYPVKTSAKLQKLADKVRARHLRQYHNPT